MRKPALFGTAALLVIAVCQQAGGAQAQAQDETAVQEVIVTGSRIARRDFVAPSPIVTTDRDALRQSGAPTLDASLLQLPQFTPGTGSFTNPTGGGNIGQATLNLRGLGSQRNLVLLDGRRLQPSNSNSVIDINTIPSAAIAGVEVISGGASATYGSDALSGVVNFKLRHRFNGIEADAQVGFTDEGGGGSRQLSAVAGRTLMDGKLSVMVSGEYTRRKALSTQQRPYFAGGGLGTSTLPQEYYVPDGNNRPTQASINTVFGAYGVAAGAVTTTSNLGFNGDGSLFKNGGTTQPSLNYRGPTAQPFITTNAPGVVTYNGGYYNLIQIPLRRENLFGRVEYDASDNVQVYAQALYSGSRASSQGSEPTLATFWQIDVPVTNPYVPADLRSILATRPRPTATFALNGRYWAAGPRAFTTNTDTYQLLGGVAGKLDARNISYDVNFAHGGYSEKEHSTSGAVSADAMRRLVSAPDGGASLCSGGYNPFGMAPVSPACVAYVQRFPTNRTDTAQSRIEGSVTGDLFALPGGMAKLNVTADWQKNTYTFNPDAELATGTLASISSTTFTHGEVNVKEAAAEVLLPLIANVPLIESFNVNAGYRYSKYNLFSGVSTWKADFDWRVAAPLLIRGGYQRAVRAPNIAELFQAPGQAIVGIGNTPQGGDPCDVRSSFRLGPNGAAVRNLCLATGLNPAIADSFQQITNSIVGQTSGNRDLMPETANTWTIGGVVRPTTSNALLSGISLSVDYYNIKITDVIATLTASTSLTQCFNGNGSNPSYSPTNFYCTLFKRDPVSGLFSTADQPFFNLGGYRTSGVDAQFDWRVRFADLGLGTGAAVHFSTLVNYLGEFSIKTLPSAPFLDYNDTVSGGQVYPRWKALTTLSVDLGGLEVGLRWRHIDDMKDSSAVTNPAAPAAGVKAYDYYDLTARGEIGKNVEVRAGVTNLQNKLPPNIGGAQGNTNAAVYDPVGRAFYFGLRAKY